MSNIGCLTFGATVMIFPHTLVVLFVFSAVTVLHALVLRRKINWSFTTHLWILGILWAIALIAGPLYLIAILPTMPPVSPAGGLVLVALGLGTSAWHGRILGWRRLMGLVFFDTKHVGQKVARGLYRHIKNPMYDGFLIVFLGLYLWHGNLDFLLLAGASYILLNQLLARVERF